MEKLKNTPLYIKTLVLLSALLWGGSIWGQTTYTNNGTETYTGEPTELKSNHTSTCGGPFTVDYTLSIISGTGSAVLQWSQDQSNWDDVDGTGSVIDINSDLYLRVSITNLSVNGEVQLTLNVTENTDLGIRLITHQHITCHGDNDGEITVEAYCGNNTSYTYAWEYTSGDYSSDFANPGNVTSASELSAGTYIITVTDGNNDTEQLEVTLNEPPILTHSVSGSEVICNEEEGNFTVSVQGGTPPFTVTVNTTDQTGSVDQNTFLYEDQNSDTYTINVTDANGCVSTSGEQTITIVEDNLAPTGCVAPDDFTMLLSDYLALDSTYVLISESSSTTYKFVPDDPDTILFEYDASGYNKMYFDFEVTQGGSSWNENDVISFYVDYNEDDPINGELLYESIGEYQMPNTEPNIDSLRLPALADNVGTLYLYIVYKAGSGNSYSITDVTLSGNNMTSTIAASGGAGAPTGCTDIYSNAIITHSDGPINWVCNVEGNQEFWFERTFTVADECGNDVEYTQKIGVGEYPEIDEPRDTILDYCHYASIDIPVPGYTDNSTGCEKTVDFKYVLRDETDNDSISGGTDFTGETTAITFPPSEANDTTFVITWIATDEAGLQDRVKQSVTILKPITIKLTPDETDFCSGEEVSFEFTIEGGTGSYGTVQETDITPSETLSVSGSSYTFTTSSLELDGTENITINVTDSDVSNYSFGGETYSVQGGCPEIITFENGDDFTIHQKISTNALERVD